MTISDSFSDSLNSFFKVTANDAIFRAIPSFEDTYLTNSLFDKFLRVDLSSSHVEIPVFGKNKVEEILVQNIMETSNVKELNINLFHQRHLGLCKTSNSIFKIICRYLNTSRLVRIKTYQGEVYYGGQGIILDKNGSPILFATIEADIEDDYIKENNAKIYISPSVFSSDNMFEKSIRRQVIPYYLEEGVYVGTYNRLVLHQFKLKRYSKTIPEIVIKDISNKFFIAPYEPKDSEMETSTVNKFLANQADLIGDIILQ